jgi:hypothetical protein
VTWGVWIRLVVNGVAELHRGGIVLGTLCRGRVNEMSLRSIISKTEEKQQCKEKQTSHIFICVEKIMTLIFY